MWYRYGFDFLSCDPLAAPQRYHLRKEDDKMREIFDCEIPLDDDDDDDDRPCAWFGSGTSRVVR